MAAPARTPLLIRLLAKQSGRCWGRLYRANLLRKRLFLFALPSEVESSMTFAAAALTTWRRPFDQILLQLGLLLVLL